MINLKKKHIVIISVLALSLGCFISYKLPYFLREIPVDRMRLAAFDIRGFQDTPAWDLAKAVDDEDVDEINRQVIENKIPVDYNNNRDKWTLLMIASRRVGKVKSVNALLELGADPNARSAREGITALMIASEDNKTPDIVKLLLKYGADPNAEANGYHAPNALDARETPLLTAVGNNLETVKLLVEAGADINYKSPTNRFTSTVNYALTGDNYDIALYLIKKGADYNATFTRFNGTVVDILVILREDIYDLGSEKHRQKMELVAWLKDHGLDYWKQPIPKWAVQKIKEKISIRLGRIPQKILKPQLLFHSKRF